MKTLVRTSKTRRLRVQRHVPLYDGTRMFEKKTDTAVCSRAVETVAVKARGFHSFYDLVAYCPEGPAPVSTRSYVLCHSQWGWNDNSRAIHCPDGTVYLFCDKCFLRILREVEPSLEAVFFSGFIEQWKKEDETMKAPKPTGTNGNNGRSQYSWLRVSELAGPVEAVIDSRHANENAEAENHRGPCPGQYGLDIPVTLGRRQVSASCPTWTDDYRALLAAFGDDLEKWVGQRIRLSPVPYRTKKGEESTIIQFQPIKG